ncbi:MAG TPA: YncE family protein [Vicinamibacteria bacterium]|nr:YncE family protein [Vicinamibacteria bacterium]
MNKNRAGLVLIPLALMAMPAVGLGQGAPQQGPYRKLTEIAIGGEGGWDYLSVDAVNRRLYVSHATKVVVVDVDTNKVVGEVAPTPGVHGIAVAPELGRGFVSNGRESTVSIFDLKTLQTVGKVTTGENPDAILYVPPQKEVWAFNGRGRSATVFDAQTGAVRATVPLPGKPEFSVFDEKTGRVYDNIEDTSQLVAIDAVTHQLAATWPIAPGQEASGLALDPSTHRLFVGCSNELMLMVDATAGKVLASVPIGAGVDANAFDPGTGLAFASSSDGTLTVAREDPAGALKVVQALVTPPRSRTMTLDPKTHRLYVAAAEFAPAPPAADGRPQRPQVVAGSFKIVVYEMQK